METQAAEQLNINFIRLPKSDKLNALAFGRQRVIGEIFSFTGEDKEGKPLTCFRTYNKFSDRCQVSRATVGRALKIGRESKLIEGNHKKGFKCLIEAENGEFLRLPNWVCANEFEVRKGKFRKLKNSELATFAVFYTRCTDRGNSKHAYTTSNADLAEETGLSERSVGRAKWTLIRAGLVFLAKEDKGKNGYKKSRYVLNYELVRKYEKTESQRRNEVRRELERAKAKEKAAETAAKPLTEEEIGKEEWALHKPKVNKRGSSRRKKKIAIPEMSAYISHDKGFIDFDLSSASDVALKALYSRYSPLWSELSITSQGFLEFIRIELKERGSPP